MTLGKFLLAALAAGVAFPAVAAVTVLGNSSARMCYEAAESDLSARSSLAYCNRALNEEALSAEDMVATHVNRGILLMRGGKVDEAIADFDRAIVLDSNEPEAYLNKGVAFLKREQAPAAALPLFTTAIEKRTRRPELAYYGRGIAHEISGNVKAAYNDYKLASSLAPDWEEPRLELARFRVSRP